MADAKPAIQQQIKMFLLGRLLRSAAVLRHEVVHRRLHAAFLVRDIGQRQCHFCCGKSAQQLWNQYGLAVAGSLAPTGTTRIARVRGLIGPITDDVRRGVEESDKITFADDKACFAGIVFALRNAVRWNHIPPPFPSGVTCWRRHRDWTKAGVWGRVWRVVLAELAEAGLLDTTELFLDATFAEARKGACVSAGLAAVSG